MALSLTADSPRKFASGIENKFTDAIVKASTTVYDGQVLATDVANHAGLAIPFDAAGTFTSPIFLGFCQEKVVQGASTSYRAKIRKAGRVILATITGATTAASIGVTVYASNDSTFTLTSTNNLAIGKIVEFVSGEGFHVEFEGDDVRSI